MGLVASVVTGACSATGDGSDFGAGGNSSTQSGNPSGSGTDGAGGLFGSTASVGTGNVPDSGCAATQSKAEQVPLDMYIMFDQSGSMSDAAGNTTKWNATTAALKAFVEQPDAVGIGVGLQYFPTSTGASCNPICTTNADCGACGPCMLAGFFGICAGAANEGCDVAEYAKPEVAIAPLPGVAPSIIASMNAHSPSGGTPTSAALQGAIDHAKGWATQNPDHVVVTVLATDGDPTNCDTNLNNINAIAAAGANGVPKVLTFVIGVGNSSAALNGIAQAGGTKQAFFVDANQSATDEFLKAMNEIRGAALACSYLIPQPEMGELDFGNVNVQFKPAGGEPIVIPKVNSIAECPASGFAWFYDNNAEPKQIIMCDATCETIKMDTEGEVSILLGCETVVN
jgi:hypothetical protein